MTSTGLASGCSPRASFSSRSLSGCESMGAGCSVMVLLDHVAPGSAIPRRRRASPDNFARATPLLLGCSLPGGCLAGRRLALYRTLGPLLGQQFHGLFAG